MAYRVLCDGLPLHDIRSDELVLLNPVVHLRDNSAGSFEFAITSEHPQYNSIKKLKSEIQVFHGDIEIFCGRVAEESKDFYNQKTFYCEGELNHLVDSIQRPAEYHDLTVRGFLKILLDIHNAQVEPEKQFIIGIVTAKAPNDNLYRYTNYENTLECIGEKLIKRLGGHLRIRKIDGIRYLDYLEDYPITSNQEIEFGKNLLDYSENIDASDIASAIIPLGAELEEGGIEALRERVTIASVNDGSDFVFNQDSVDLYGWVFRTAYFDDVHTPSILKQRGEAYLTEVQFENMTLKVTALDLHHLNADIERLSLLDQVRVKSRPHGLSRLFPVSEMTIYLDSPENNTLMLGEERVKTFTSTSSSSNSEIIDKINSLPSTESILDAARDNASQIIHDATHGHVVTTANEQLIMDTDNVETAQKLWRWNLGGLGYSKTGYNGTYLSAITMDGNIVGERLIGGSVAADKIDIVYRSNVEKAIELAEDNANDATDNKLKKYYTAVETETSISNSATQILLSAKETATSYTDEQLTEYSTSAQIKLTTDAISMEVSKKLNSSELSTKIQQDATSVKIAWNNISKYIQFEDGELRIYDSAVTSSQKMVSKFNYNGSHFYRDNKYIGKIGTHAFVGQYGTERGLVFGLQYNADFMAWAADDYQGDPYYRAKLSYFHSTSAEKTGIYFHCPVYTGGNLYLNNNNRFVQYVGTDMVGYNGEIVWVNSANDIGIGIKKTSFYVSQNVSVDFYSNLNMHWYSIVNESDARLKTNIAPTKVKGLEIINALDLKEFDWLETGNHEPVGVIAQQLEQVAPDLVEADENGVLGIKTTKLIFYLAKAVQELSGDDYKKAVWTDTESTRAKKTFLAKAEAQPPKLEPIEQKTLKIPK